MESSGWRILERLKYRPHAQRQSASQPFTFLVPHHNCAIFLEVCIHAVRRLYANSPILVADSGSSRKEYLHAKSICRQFDADLRPYVFRHGHTSQFNRLLSRAQTDKTIILDQDCVLLHQLDGLCNELNREWLLIGPKDSMLLSHPNLSLQYPNLTGIFLRDAEHYIHASPIITKPKRIVDMYGTKPFSRVVGHHQTLGTLSFVEPYYGLCERLYADRPASVVGLNTVHSGYGFGMVYTYEGKNVACHQWYSGRTYRLGGKIDTLLDVEWLNSERDRFVRDAFYLRRFTWFLAPCCYGSCRCVNAQCHCVIRSWSIAELCVKGSWCAPCDDCINLCEFEQLHSYDDEMKIAAQEIERRFFIFKSPSDQAEARCFMQCNK